MLVENMKRYRRPLAFLNGNIKNEMNFQSFCQPGSCFPSFKPSQHIQLQKLGGGGEMAQ